VKPEKFKKINLPRTFIKGFIGGIGWATGATIGFTILLALLGWFFNRLGGLPLVGNFFASIVEATNQALQARRVLR